MKILLISHQLDFSGAPLALLEMARIFSARAYHLQLLFLKDGPLRHEFEELSIRCGPLNAPLLRPDLVIANTILSIPASNLLRKPGIRVVNWVHESRWFMDALKIDPLRAGFDEVTEVLLPSQFMIQELSVFFPKAVFAVLPNKVKAAESTKKGSTGRVIVPGSWERRKGQQHLLTLMAKGGVTLPLTFLGATIHEVRSLSEFEFTGQVSHSKALDLIASAKMLISPALSETQNMSALEAIARRVPVVLSNIPAHRELSQFFGGLPLFELGDPSELSQAIRRAFEESENYSLLLERAARLEVRFGQQAYEKRVLSLVNCMDMENFRQSSQNYSFPSDLDNSNVPILLSVVTVVIGAGDDLELTRLSVQPLVEAINEIEWVVKSAVKIDPGHFVSPGHPRMRLVWEHDSGIYEAMNQALRSARGEYLLFIGAGDQLYEDGIRFLISSLKRDFQAGKPLVFFASRMESWGRVWCPEPFGFSERMSAPHGAMVIRRKDILSVGGYSEVYRIAGDYDLVCRILAANPNILLWQSQSVISFCKGDGISVTNYLEAFLEECLIRMRVLGLEHKAMGLHIAKYLDHSFRVLLLKESQRATKA